MRTKAILLVLAASFATACAGPAETRSSVVPPNAQRGISTEQIAGHVLLHADVTRIVHQLADVIGPRLTGTEQCDRAEAWAAAELERSGLRVHRETYQLAQWLPGKFEVTLPNGSAVAAISTGWTGNTPLEGVEGPLRTVVIDEIDNADVQGAVVLVLPKKGMKRVAWHLARAHAIETARAHGAVALLVGTSATRAPAIDGCSPAPGLACGVTPLPVGSLAIAEVEQLRSLPEPRRLRIVARHETNANGHASNVVAELPGESLANEVVVVGAHLDTVHTSPGAVDDGMGVAAVMETARLLHALGWRPARTVRFILFTGEELLDKGSNAYVAAHSAEMSSIAAMVQIDSADVPWTGFTAFGRDDLQPRLDAVLAPLRPLGASGVFVTPDNVLTLSFSDHAPFVLAGVPALFASDQDGLVPGETFMVHTVQDSTDNLVAGAGSLDAAILSVLVTQLASGPRLGERLGPGAVRALLKRHQFEDDARALGHGELAE